MNLYFMIGIMKFKMIKDVWKREGGNCMCDIIDVRLFLEVFNFYIYIDINELKKKYFKFLEF